MDAYVVITLAAVAAVVICLFLYYRYQHTKPAKIIGGTFSAVCLIAVVIAAGQAGWEDLDKEGRLFHVRDTVISAEPSWLNGESKTCVAFPTDNEHDVTKFIQCDRGPEHNMRVKFWGRTQRDDRNGVNWKCVKDESGFVCYALN